MANKLIHNQFREDGIFGQFIFDGDTDPFMATLEHSFPVGDGTFAPIIGEGTYTCVRGTHALENGIPFETFEITGVEGHSGLLFHPGNFNKDSKGCVLCGQTVVDQPGGDEMVNNSKIEFAAFMERLEGVDSFELEVINADT